VRAIEILRQHKLDEWRHLADREQQKVLDDLRPAPGSAEILRMDDERKASAS